MSDTIEAYRKYLRQWYADHSGPEYESMEPACYEEFLDNEYKENNNG